MKGSRNKKKDDNNNSILKLLLNVGSAMVRRGGVAKIRRAPQDPSYFFEGGLMIRRALQVHVLDITRSTISHSSLKFPIPKFTISNSNSTSTQATRRERIHQKPTERIPNRAYSFCHQLYRIYEAI